MEIEIHLTSGVLVIDKEDWERLNHLTWCVDRNGYVVNSQKYREGARVRSRKVMLHRIITNAPRGMEVDHINHDPLDNRRCNLRIVTRQQNVVNGRGVPNSSSRYKGVTKRGEKWSAGIKINGKNIRLGCFMREEDAARAYDVAAVKAWGEFAYQNFPT